ncbi:A24 family peptidase [Hyphomonas oceanitis]|uniref:Pilus assembly protein CpaA n=1 Tax=Hyphomonas oceanitis SCH89 TaxID=1280953 RepID=A0A059G8S0_9PROT|nr:prepilin peptidase [Hyphomonas oceanitis]KDA03247.1 pilus assembly protein CpaA [Hyphomonas oceanitis SCH89]|tara:strand:+ start:9752 stop:10267 length:516 start_codon:yes stop_codon:yes gene_type:complete
MILNILAAAFLILCVVAALHDISRLTISNWLNLLMAGLFIPAAAVSGLPLELIGGHIMVAALAFLIAFGLFAFNIFGGGDAKMIPAVMLWLGPDAGLPFVFWMALVGGACALFILFVRRTMPAAAIPGLVRAPFEENAGVPYGVAIAAGAIAAASASPFLSDLLNQVSALS